MGYKARSYLEEAHMPYAYARSISRDIPDIFQSQRILPQADPTIPQRKPIKNISRLPLAFRPQRGRIEGYADPAMGISRFLAGFLIRPDAPGS